MADGINRRSFLKAGGAISAGFAMGAGSPVFFGGHAGLTPRRLISLDGPAWKLVGLSPGEGEKLRINTHLSDRVQFINTSVPNDVQTAIGTDPFGQGPEVVDINRKEWWYVRSFPTPDLHAGRLVRLTFCGADYFADVWLNGRKLGSHEGAYTRFGFDVTRELIRDGKNYLALRLTAPWNVPGRSHYEYMKGEFDETWDALPGPGQVVFPLGLHRGVRLEVTAETRIEKLQVWTVSLQDQRARLRVRVVISNRQKASEGSLNLVIMPENFSGPSLRFPAQVYSFSGALNESKTLEASVEIDRPQLWWTWDQGPQNLYRLQATLSDAHGATFDRTSATFGIRTLERNAKLLYKLNGRPLFVRGAWYPMSKLYPAQTDPWTYEKDLRLARHANMNHLVNYTVVEKEDFYDLADRLGILLFVELPFNQEGPLDALNAHYPRRNEFIRWSANEVGQIVEELGNHPSVGVWSALSEVTGNGTDFATAGDPRIAAAADGYRLFSQKMKEVCLVDDPDSIYHESYCDFGEHHFWWGSIQGGSYRQQFDAQADFVSEYGALAYFPVESIGKIADVDQFTDDHLRPWSALGLHVNLKRLSYLTGYSYQGLEFLVRYISGDTDRKPHSFREYVADSQVYQAFLYGYSGDAFRRKLFAPINGIRSWMFKSFPKKPLSGFGVIDCFDTPMLAYYAQKRTLAPVSMSYAVRDALESIPAGSRWTVPAWVSNATPDNLSLAVRSVLYSLKGDRIEEVNEEVSAPARQAAAAFNLDWRLPEKAGVYLLRSLAVSQSKEIARAETYLKVVPAATAKRLRILVVGTSEWAEPVADYLRNLGSYVTTVIHENSVVESSRNSFPTSAENMQRDYDLIWLTGFANYWRVAPKTWTEVIVEAVERGVIFVHTGSWASFHGGNDDQTAALDLTPLAAILPVQLRHENDVWIDSTAHRGGRAAISAPAVRIKVLPAAPTWLRQTDFSGCSLSNYHLLSPRENAAAFVEVDGSPLLVAGHYGKSRTFAYLGFSPRQASLQTLSVDQALRSSPEHRLFAVVCATLLVLASGEAPPVPLADLVKSRETPLFETLKEAPRGNWPDVSLNWLDGDSGRVRAELTITNGSTYVRGFRLRFEGPDFSSGQTLALWSDQYFDLLPRESVQCGVEFITADRGALGRFSLRGEMIYKSEFKEYPIPALQA